MTPLHRLSNNFLEIHKFLVTHNVSLGFDYLACFDLLGRNRLMHIFDYNTGLAYNPNIEALKEELYPIGFDTVSIQTILRKHQNQEVLEFRLNRTEFPELQRRGGDLDEEFEEGDDFSHFIVKRSLKKNNEVVLSLIGFMLNKGLHLQLTRNKSGKTAFDVLKEHVKPLTSMLPEKLLHHCKRPLISKAKHKFKITLRGNNVEIIEKGEEFVVCKKDNTVYAKLEVKNLAFTIVRTKMTHVVRVGFHEEKGLRPTMEDAHILCPSLNISSECSASLFAIFDGMEKLLSEKDFQSCGAVGIIVLIVNERVICANVGDCRALMFAFSEESNDDCEMVQMSRDFKAGYEKERMQQIGVKVVPGLPSRSFGDFQYKQPQVKITLNKPSLEHNVIIATPEVQSFHLNNYSKKKLLIVMACDGLFDKLSNQDVQQFVLNHKRESEQRLAESLCAQAIEKKTKDNVSVVVIGL
ncbi:hypothetical protein C9374_003026 [Naegleria lovaniensis]|uniref:PPM-type phosphatase domain-containing protein n=1 Tax=Naegleria lovaniensis TaxID=51637 RepID=A0AA88GRU5_NAELO|nr:uncharacterized protein C9374_003026 [Naegleria lovaniensis]KAG2385877.1 hypothetical protein C9374_003026 [Naegleria lovaniensis]